MNIFHRVAVQSLKKNRTRTIVTIIGVILSAAMFTAVTTMVSTLYSYLERMQSYERGSYYLSFSGAPHEAVREMQSDSDTRELACGEYLGYGQITGQRIRRGPYVYALSMSGNFLDLLPVHLTGGRMPENAAELLLPDHLLNYGNVAVEVGDTIEITLGDRFLDGVQLWQNSAADENEEFVPRQTRSYTVVGTYAKPGFEESQAPGYTVLTVGEGSGTGFYDAYVQLDSASTKALDAFTARYGSRVSGSVLTNWSYLRVKGNMRYGNLDSSLFQFCAILFFMIMLGSVSLIYSAFSISVSERTRQFGLLSSVGATRKQLRRTVVYEAYIVSLIGIPLGLLAGCGGMWVTFSLLGDRLGRLLDDSVPLVFHVSLPALAVAALIGLLTVRISTMIPARRAMRVTAIEAIRQSRDVKTEKRRISSGRLAYRLFGLPGMLSKKYFQRSRKKYRATILSLGLSVLLFISASTYGMYLTDTASDAAGVNSYDYYYSVTELSQEQAEKLTEELRGAGGVAEAWCAARESVTLFPQPADLSESYRQMLDRSEPAAAAGGADDRLSMEIRYGEDGGLSMEICHVDAATYAALCAAAGVSPESGGAIFLNHISRVNYVQENRYTYDGTVLREDTKELTLFSYYEDIPGYAGTGRYTQNADGSWVCEYAQFSPSDYWETHDSEKEPAVLTRPATVRQLPLAGTLTATQYTSDSSSAKIYLPMKAEDEKASEIDFFVIASDPDRARQSMSAALSAACSGFREEDLLDVRAGERQMRDMLTVINVFSYGFITLISLICVANVFNTISTNVAVRRRDFAMLRSVGMTQGGIYRMMGYECLLYGVRALLIGLPLSAGVAWLISRAAREIGSGGFRMPWGSVAVAVVCVFLVVFVSMLYAVSKIRRDNPVETLKEENI